MWHVHKTEKFQYPVSDVILKCRERAHENSVSNTGCYKINGAFNHKTFNADHVRLTSKKHTRSLAAEGEFL